MRVVSMSVQLRHFALEAVKRTNLAEDLRACSVYRVTAVYCALATCRARAVSFNAHRAHVAPPGPSAAEAASVLPCITVQLTPHDPQSVQRRQVFQICPFSGVLWTREVCSPRASSLQTTAGLWTQGCCNNGRKEGHSARSKPIEPNETFSTFSTLSRS